MKESMIGVFDAFEPFRRMEGSTINFVHSVLPLVEGGYCEWCHL